jgi:hypothetical protein
LDDDVFFNWTIQYTMTVSRSSLFFRAKHKIHLDTFQLLLPALSSLGNLVVDINVSTSFFQFHLHSTLSNFIFFNSIYIQLCPILSLSIPFTFNFVQFYLFQFHLHSTLSNFISFFAQLCMSHFILQISLKGFH